MYEIDFLAHDKKNQTMNIKKILSDKFDEEKKKTAQTN